MKNYYKIKSQKHAKLNLFIEEHFLSVPTFLQDSKATNNIHSKHTQTPTKKEWKNREKEKNIRPKVPNNNIQIPDTSYALRSTRILYHPK